MPPTPRMTKSPSTIAGRSGPLWSAAPPAAVPGEEEGCVAPPTVVGVDGGLPVGVSPADGEPRGDRAGLAAVERVGLAEGRGVAAGGLGVGLGVGTGVGVGGAVDVTWPAGRSATLPIAVAEKVTLLVPAGSRRDPRHVPLEVVPLTRLSATVKVPTRATTLVAGFPA